MAHDHGARPETLRLSVHRRYVMDQQGQLRDQAFVQCPVEQGAVLLIECSRCGHCAASLSDLHGALMVDCVPPVGEPAVRDSAVTPASNDPVSAAATTRALGLSCRNTLCVSVDADLIRAASAVHQLGVARSVVVDPDLLPVGIVADDVVERAGRSARGSGRVTAGDVMRPVQACLPTDVTVSLASAAMAQTGVEAVPLVTANGDVIAVFRAIDVIRWFASLDGYVLSEAVDPSLDAAAHRSPVKP